MMHRVVWLRGAICDYREFTFCIATAFGTATLNYEFHVGVKLGCHSGGRTWTEGVFVYTRDHQGV
jgi:hypothetical protein